VFTPNPTQPPTAQQAAAPAGGTADSIRARLAAAKGQKA